MNSIKQVFIDKMEGPFIKSWLDRMENMLMITFPECSQQIFIKEEQMVNFARIMLVIYNSAKEEKDIDEIERLTYKHIIAIKRANRRLLNRIHNSNQVDTSLFITVDIIDQDITQLTRIVSIFRTIRDNIVYDGMKRTDEDKDILLYGNIKQFIPDLTKGQFGHLIDLVVFLDLVQRSPNYEKQYLRYVYAIYHQNVTDDIRKDLGLV